MDLEISQSIGGYWAVSNRILLVKLNGRPFNVNIIQAYSLTEKAAKIELILFIVI